MKELTITALVENLNTVLAFVDEQLEAEGCPMRAQLQIDVAVEEIFVNIAHYAYAPEQGPATIRAEIVREPATAMVLTFLDEGVPYNPLAKEDPDVTQSAEERQIGGLGIFMVKKSIDTMEYEFKDGKNILTLKKALFSK